MVSGSGLESTDAPAVRTSGGARGEPWVSSAHAGFVSALALGPLAEAEYHECRLGAGQERVDYLVAFPRRHARTAHGRLRQLAGSSDAWAPLLALFARWADGRSLLSAHVPTIWLELDDVPPQRGLPLPSVSLCLVPAYRLDRPLPALGADRAHEVVADALDVLLPQRHPAIDVRVAECFERLPEGARWIHASVMTGRTPRAVKLYGSFPRAQLLSWLRQMCFAGDLAAIEGLLQSAYGPDLTGDELFVDLNLDDFRDPRRCTLGLALGQQHVARAPERDPTRERALARWVAAGLSIAERAVLASAWLDIASSSSRSAFLDLKLVWQAGGEPQAKAYLGWFSGMPALSSRASATSGGS